MAAERGGHVWHRRHHRPPQTSQTDGDLMSLCTDVTWQQTLHNESPSNDRPDLSRDANTQSRKRKTRSNLQIWVQTIQFFWTHFWHKALENIFFYVSDVYWVKELCFNARKRKWYHQFCTKYWNISWTLKQDRKPWSQPTNIHLWKKPLNTTASEYERRSNGEGVRTYIYSTIKTSGQVFHLWSCLHVWRFIYLFLSSTK